MEERIRRTIFNSAMKRIVMSFTDGKVIIYDTSLKPLKQFQSSQMEKKIDPPHPTLWTRQINLSNVALTQMGVIISTGSMMFFDPDLVEDEARHGLFWFDYNKEVDYHFVRKPNESDKMCVLNMVYVDKWHRLFTYDFQHKVISEFVVEFKYAKATQGQGTRLLQNLEQFRQISELCAQQ